MEKVFVSYFLSIDALKMQKHVTNVKNSTCECGFIFARFAFLYLKWYFKPFSL